MSNFDHADVTASSCRKDPEPPTLGILLVHGIGQQPYGRTLISGTDALAQWLQWRLGDSPRRRETGKGFQVDVEVKHLRHTEPAASATPAHARLTVQGPDGARETWIVAESWWANSFPRPSWGRLMGWTILSAIVTFNSEIVELVDQMQSSWKMRRPLSFAINLGRLYLYLLLLAPLLMFMIFVSLAAFMPWVRGVALRAQSALTGSVGDSFALVGGNTARAAIIGKTRQDVEWLVQSENIDRLVVVAHSQGAEVARQALAQTDILDGKRLQLITYGSAIKKLAFLQRLRPERRALFYAGVVLGSTALLVFSIFALLGITAFLARRQIFLQSIFPEVYEHDTARWIAYLTIAVLLPGLLSLFTRILAEPEREGPSKRPHLTTGKPVATRWINIRHNLQFFVICVVSILILGSLSVADITHSSERPWTGAAPFIVVAILIVLGLSLWITRVMGRHQFSVVTPPHSPKVQDFVWTDVIATSDPVTSPGVRSRAPENAQPQEVLVYNKRSILLDHSTYWQNWNQFLPCVIQAIGRISTWKHRQLIVVPQFWAARESSARRQQTLELLLLRIETIFLTVGMLLLSGVEFDGLAGWLHRSRIILTVLHFEIPTYLDGSIGRYVPRLLVDLAFILGYAALSIRWQEGQKRRYRESLHLLRMFDDACLALGDLDSVNSAGNLRIQCAAQVLHDSQLSLLLVGEKSLYLFPIVAGELGRPLRCIPFSEVRQLPTGIRTIKIQLAGERLYIRVIDPAARRDVKAALANQVNSSIPGR